MKIKIDLTTNLCHYDGVCLLSDKLEDEEEYPYCNGNCFGKDYCPLKQSFAEIEIKDNMVDNVKKCCTVKVVE